MVNTLRDRPLTVGIAVAIFSALVSAGSGALSYVGTVQSVAQEHQSETRRTAAAMATMEQIQRTHSREIASFRDHQQRTDIRLERIEEVLFAIARRQGVTVPKRRSDP